MLKEIVAYWTLELALARCQQRSWIYGDQEGFDFSTSTWMHSK